MKVKIFMDNRAETLERRINDWFDNEAGTAEIIKMETVMAPVPETDGDIYPCMVVTIWFEPPSN
jgi:hypothetical protein